jgi:hypothetical protein
MALLMLCCYVLPALLLDRALREALLRYVASRRAPRA